MRAVADRFHRGMELKPEESIKAFLFAVKAVAAMGFMFVFGHVAATGTVESTGWLILLLAAVLDLLPEILTVRILPVLPERAQTAEKLQLFLKVVAYAVLLSLLAEVASQPVLAYAVFAVLWLASFVVEEAVMFMLEEPDSR